MNTIDEPRLAAPGAGLPPVELLIARLIFKWNRWTQNREKVNARFAAERAIIQNLVTNCRPDAAATRVLIKRVPGLEDSSRYWSLWMTLEHLRIIHGGIARTIKSLAKGVVPPGKASTAKVKPADTVTAAVVEAYEKSCDDLLSTVATVPDLRTRARFEHPWFGPLDASGWHAMAASHIAIHRVQIQRIRAGLGEK